MQAHQVHGNTVYWFGWNFNVCHPDLAKIEIPPEPISVSADVLATDDPRRGVGVRIADCAPILVADRAGRAVAAVHAGWRGTAARAARAGVEAMRIRAGINPPDLIAAIGPSIRACCYEVGPELRDRFAAAGHDKAAIDRWFSKGKGDRWQLDVPRANRDQLEAAGVPSEQIFDSGLCTACHTDVFHSYRKTGPGAGRMIGVIRVKALR